MNNQHYFKSILLCCGICTSTSNFGGGGMSKVDRVLDEIKNGPPQPRSPSPVPSVLEMQPLLGSTESSAEWVVVYEPKGDKDWEDEEPRSDAWISHMEEEAQYDKKHPGYRGMSRHPQYTAISISKPVLDIPLQEDEEGTVRFLKNYNTHAPESTCCDRLSTCALDWYKSCVPCGIGYWWVKLTSRDEKYGFNNRDKSSAVVRKSEI